MAQTTAAKEIWGDQLGPGRLIWESRTETRSELALALELDASRPKWGFFRHFAMADSHRVLTRECIRGDHSIRVSQKGCVLVVGMRCLFPVLTLKYEKSAYHVKVQDGF